VRQQIDSEDGMISVGMSVRFQLSDKIQQVYLISHHRDDVNTLSLFFSLPGDRLQSTSDIIRSGDAVTH
jgi:hypothetical protein